MKKKQKRIVVFVIVLLIGILLISSSSLNFPLAVGDSASDLSILSISKTTINGEPGIRILANANGGAELLDIDWGSSYLNSQLKQNGIYDLSAKDSIQGSITVGEQSLEFLFSSTGDFVYGSARVVDLGTFTSCNYNNCKNRANFGEDILEYDRDEFFGCNCLIGSEKATIGKWGSLIKGDYPLTFSIDGLGSTTLSRNRISSSINQADIGSSAKIKFQGFLDSYDRINVPPYDPFLYKNKIILLEPTKIRDIDSALISLRQGEGGRANYDTTTYNNLMRRYLSDEYINYLQEDYIYTASRDVSGIKITLEKPTSYPTFTIDLNAEDVGIVKQSGQPENLYCSDTEFQGNELGSTTCSVRNSRGLGAFAVNLINCDTSAFVAGGNNLGTFNEGQTKSFSVSLQGTTEKKDGEKGECRVEVYDLNDPSKSDSYVFVYKIKYNPGGKCNPIGKLICSEDMKNILECKSSGDYEFKEKCEFGCGYGNSGSALCLVESEGNGCKWYDISCLFKGIRDFSSNLFGGVFGFVGTIRIIISILVGIFAFLFGKDIFEDMTKGRYGALSWVLSIIVGVFLFFLAYKSFWIGVIVFIIWIVFRLIIGNKITLLKQGVKRLRR